MHVHDGQEVPAIKRLYIYQFNGEARARFDAGLIDPKHEAPRLHGGQEAQARACRR